MKDTKEKILETAYDLFLSNSYEAVTINSIIEATGLTKGGIYHYFSSKEEIFKAVVDRYMTENLADLNLEHPSLKEMIEYHVLKIKNQMHRKAGMLSGIGATLPLQHVSLLVTAFRYYPGYVEIKNSFLSSVLDGWKKVITEAIRTGEIRGDIDIEILAFSFFNASSGIVANIVFSNSIDYAINMYERQLNEIYKLLKK